MSQRTTLRPLAFAPPQNHNDVDARVCAMMTVKNSRWTLLP
jgi:hypothetical protein